MNLESFREPALFGCLCKAKSIKIVLKDLDKICNLIKFDIFSKVCLDPV